MGLQLLELNGEANNFAGGGGLSEDREPRASGIAHAPPEVSCRRPWDASHQTRSSCAHLSDLDPQALQWQSNR